MRELAYAKFNRCLFLGPTRPDGRHELVTVFEPLTLADVVTLEVEGEEDAVVCPGVEGPNLALDAVRAFRAATGWDGPPVRLTIEKRIPVAAGMGGGSADAAAALRLVREVSGVGDEALLLDLAAQLGADVPSQVRPRRVLATGIGDVLQELPPPRGAYGVLVLPSEHALSTGAVYAEADRLGLARDAAGLKAKWRFAVGGSVAAPTPDDLVNDLEPAARSLCPAIDEALDAARGAGAGHAMVSGSGPTVVGLFPNPAEAEAAAAALAGREPAPIPCSTLVPSE